MGELDLVHAVAAAGSQLPPEIRKSLFKAAASLIAGLADVPAAWLEGKAAAIRSTTAARNAVTEAAGKAVAERFSADPALAERAMAHFAGRLLGEQKNRESVVAKALDEIAQAPPTAGTTGTVDDDWIASFGRLSETRSSSEMQAYFARILAGEVKRPGTFRLATLDVAAKLTTDLAETFRTFCNCSSTTALGTKLVASPFGSEPASNELTLIGLDFSVLSELQDAGLLVTNLNMYQKAPVAETFVGTFELGGATFRGVPQEPDAETTHIVARRHPHVITVGGPRIHSVNFTSRN